MKVVWIILITLSITILVQGRPSRLPSAEEGIPSPEKFLNPGVLPDAERKSEAQDLSGSSNHGVKPPQPPWKILQRSLPSVGGERESDALLKQQDPHSVSADHGVKPIERPWTTLKRRLAGVMPSVSAERESDGLLSQQDPHSGSTDFGVKPTEAPWKTLKRRLPSVSAEYESDGLLSQHDPHSGSADRGVKPTEAPWKTLKKRLADVLPSVPAEREPDMSLTQNDDSGSADRGVQPAEAPWITVEQSLEAPRVAETLDENLGASPKFTLEQAIPEEEAFPQTLRMRRSAASSQGSPISEGVKYESSTGERWTSGLNTNKVMRKSVRKMMNKMHKMASPSTSEWDTGKASDEAHGSKARKGASPFASEQTTGKSSSEEPKLNGKEKPSLSLDWTTGPSNREPNARGKMGSLPMSAELTSEESSELASEQRLNKGPGSKGRGRKLRRTILVNTGKPGIISEKLKLKKPKLDEENPREPPKPEATVEDEEPPKMSAEDIRQSGRTWRSAPKEKRGARDGQVKHQNNAAGSKDSGLRWTGLSSAHTESQRPEAGGRRRKGKKQRRQDDDDDDLSVAAVAAIISASLTALLVVFILVAALVYFWRRKYKVHRRKYGDDEDCELTSIMCHGAGERRPTPYPMPQTDCYPPGTVVEQVFIEAPKKKVHTNGMIRTFRGATDRNSRRMSTILEEKRIGRHDYEKRRVLRQQTEERRNSLFDSISAAKAIILDHTKSDILVNEKAWERRRVIRECTAVPGVAKSDTTGQRRYSSFSDEVQIACCVITPKKVLRDGCKKASDRCHSIKSQLSQMRKLSFAEQIQVGKQVIVDTRRNEELSELANKYYTMMDYSRGIKPKPVYCTSSNRGVVDVSYSDERKEGAEGQTQVPQKKGLWASGSSTV